MTKEEKRNYQNEYRLRNRDMVNEKKRAYYQRNKEKMKKEAQRRYYLNKNKEPKIKITIIKESESRKIEKSEYRKNKKIEYWTKKMNEIQGVK